MHKFDLDNFNQTSGNGVVFKLCSSFFFRISSTSNDGEQRQNVIVLTNMTYVSSYFLVKRNQELHYCLQA